ncbi:MAG: MBL fold metallo-hydrolase [Ruminococcaceae bacterium]|nr:MBL fold metallo-hydrolase [Oscillospiraceae bacterium]
MKKTFTTVLPDRIGAFLRADRCLTRLGLNITRVSYNKAVDAHMLFIEVDGTEEQLALADEELSRLGYLNDPSSLGEVILIEFRLRDEVGALLPILELIDDYNFNISYISSQENGTHHQYFKMGLYVENGREISDFIKRASLLCRLKIIDYKGSEKILDNTVFYLSFASDIAERMDLEDDEKNELIINSNLIMQLLDEKNAPVYKTFDYIRQFAEKMCECKGEDFKPRISRIKGKRGTEVLLIEPPCGSNICVIDAGDHLLFIDSGFSLYRNELLNVLRREISDFDKRERRLILTHADVDHAGILDIFDKVYLNRKCYDNFMAERRGGPAIREENPVHAPYVKISKILSDYHPSMKDNFEIIGGNDDKISGMFEEIGTLKAGELEFELYEGAGGHVAGEMIIVERNEGLAFTGDILVNIKGFTADQKSFNRLAPFLMTSVDTDPELAKAERAALPDILGISGWTVIGGHGGAMTM